MIARSYWRWSGRCRIMFWQIRTVLRARGRGPWMGGDDGNAYLIPPGYTFSTEYYTRQIERLAAVARDMDRDRHGNPRHVRERLVDVQRQARITKEPGDGNTINPPGSIIGWRNDGRPLVVPDDPHDPDAWDNAARRMGEAIAIAQDHYRSAGLDVQRIVTAGGDIVLSEGAGGRNAGELHIPSPILLETKGRYRR